MKEKRFEDVKGRSARANPKNRFEQIEVESDPAEFDPEEPRPETTFFKDRTRSIIGWNDSPDIGVNAGVSPYRGCEHGCAYCLSGDTPILMANGKTCRLEDVCIGDEIYGTMRRGWYRRYMKTSVLAHWRVDKPAYRVTLADGTSLVAGGDHRFLTERGWKFVSGSGSGERLRPHLTTGNKLMGTGAFVQRPSQTLDYKKGYLCGVIRGDGLLKSYEYEREGRAHGNVHQFRLALVDEEPLDRAADYLEDFGISTSRFVFQENVLGRKNMSAIRTYARKQVESIENLVSWPHSSSTDWCKGFLVGIFDAEGSYSGGILRIPNTDSAIIQCIVDCLERLAFDFAIEDVSMNRTGSTEVVRIRKGLAEHLRFFHTVNASITRKLDIEGQAVKSNADLQVTSIEALGTLPLFDITTGTGDFIANGVVSHNCFARPSHEYLGLSAGLDFETKILVKERAPELLRKQFSSPNWKPQVVAMSGNVDVYQPIEKKLRLTRQCLEVFAEFRNPVAIITKNHLVTRDVDLLSELARFDAVSVAVSLTTLDEDLRRVMEPRTSSPRRRLVAIEKLSDAGVRVGVMTAPIIPGLNDHELPNLLSAAANAGAKFAGYTAVRLPYAVRPLFEDWLGRNFPDRKDKVLNRIREIRGGKLNDPRFGSRMRGEGVYAEHLAHLFDVSRRRAGIPGKSDFSLSTAAFRRYGGDQPELF